MVLYFYVQEHRRLNRQWLWIKTFQRWDHGCKSHSQAGPAGDRNKGPDLTVLVVEHLHHTCF